MSINYQIEKAIQDTNLNRGVVNKASFLMERFWKNIVGQNDSCFFVTGAHEYMVSILYDCLYFVQQQGYKNIWIICKECFTEFPKLQDNYPFLRIIEPESWKNILNEQDQNQKYVLLSYNAFLIGSEISNPAQYIEFMNSCKINPNCVFGMYATDILGMDQIVRISSFTNCLVFPDSISSDTLKIIFGIYGETERKKIQNSIINETPNPLFSPIPPRTRQAANISSEQQLRLEEGDVDLKRCVAVIYTKFIDDKIYLCRELKCNYGSIKKIHKEKSFLSKICSWAIGTLTYNPNSEE